MREGSTTVAVLFENVGEQNPHLACLLPGLAIYVVLLAPTFLTRDTLFAHKTPHEPFPFRHIAKPVGKLRGKSSPPA